MPANLIPLCFPFRVYTHFHPIVEQTIWFAVVQYVEFHFVVSLRILYSKKEPLRVALCVHVILHQKVVFCVRNFLSQIEISTFKARLKHQSFIILVSRVVQLGVQWSRFHALLLGATHHWGPLEGSHTV